MLPIKSHLISHTANSDIFYLSAEARKKQNPYEALREIPKLVVNESDRSIKMVDGATPLILINGHKVNSGINSIDPKEVEAVEVINNPSARYLKDGVQCVVNIKMKQRNRRLSDIQYEYTPHDSGFVWVYGRLL